MLTGFCEDSGCKTKTNNSLFVTSVRLFLYVTSSDAGCFFHNKDRFIVYIKLLATFVCVNKSLLTNHTIIFSHFSRGLFWRKECWKQSSL